LPAGRRRWRVRDQADMPHLGVIEGLLRMKLGLFRAPSFNDDAHAFAEDSSRKRRKMPSISWGSGPQFGDAPSMSPFFDLVDLIRDFVRFFFGDDEFFAGPLVASLLFSSMAAVGFGRMKLRVGRYDKRLRFLPLPAMYAPVENRGRGDLSK